MTLYFAYGSNLDSASFMSRYRSAKKVGIGQLKDYRLEFTHMSKGWQCGTADIVMSPGSEVWGIIYDIDDADLSYLDVQEGTSSKAYKRVIVRIETLHKQSLQVSTYKVVNRDGFIAPSKEYIGIIKKEAKALGFPPLYVNYLDSITTSNE